MDTSPTVLLPPMRILTKELSAKNSLGLLNGQHLKLMKYFFLINANPCEVDSFYEENWRTDNDVFVNERSLHIILVWRSELFVLLLIKPKLNTTLPPEYLFK